MNSDIIKGNWKEIKGQIKAKWGKLKEDDIESLQGNMSQLSGQLQKNYGYAKEKAEKEYKEFTQKLAKNVNSKMDPTEKATELSK